MARSPCLYVWAPLPLSFEALAWKGVEYGSKPVHLVQDGGKQFDPE